MNLTLKRDLRRPDGIFSTLIDDKNEVVAKTLEHSYGTGSDYVPKLIDGVYTCIRGMHRLHSMNADFETFEITGVLGHEGILFHVGNFNRDSEGCCLLGTRVVNAMDGSLMISESHKAFEYFMQLQHGCNSFQLTVIS